MRYCVLTKDTTLIFLRAQEIVTIRVTQLAEQKLACFLFWYGSMPRVLTHMNDDFFLNWCGKVPCQRHISNNLIVVSYFEEIVISQYLFATALPLRPT